jgi:RNA polymerase sigma factor (sigma-70 family)
MDDAILNPSLGSTETSGGDAESSDDLVLLERYRRYGDTGAFQRIVERYQRMVLQTCRRVLSDQSDAEDAAQETFIKLAQHAHLVSRHVAAWLHRCAHNSALDMLRARRSRDARERHAGKQTGQHSHEETISVDTCQAIDACMAELPVAHREVLIGYFWLGRTQQDMAERLGISQVAVKKRIDRGLESLRASCVRRGLATAGVVLGGLLGQLGAEEPATASLSRLAQWRPPPPTPGASALPLVPIGVTVLAALVAASLVLVWNAEPSSPIEARIGAPVIAPQPEQSLTIATVKFPADPLTLSLDAKDWTMTGLTASDAKPGLHLVSSSIGLRESARFSGVPLPQDFAVTATYTLKERLCPFCSILFGLCAKDPDSGEVPKPLDTRQQKISRPAGSSIGSGVLRMEVRRTKDHQVEQRIFCDGQEFIYTKLRAELEDVVLLGIVSADLVIDNMVVEALPPLPELEF